MIARNARSAVLAAVAAVCSIAATAQSAWLDVPFVAQSENGCGAAVISMTLQYWNGHGANVSADAFNLDSIQTRLYSRKDRGIKASAMTRYFKDQGFRAFAFRGEISDLQQHIAKGRPVIAALQESRDASILHYVVVVGVDEANRLVQVNDPAQRKLLKMDVDDFRKRWSGTDYWSLLVVPQS